MNDEPALLAAILADPEDDTARLVYADCLEENGKGDLARFIRRYVADGWLPLTVYRSYDEPPWWTVGRVTRPDRGPLLRSVLPPAEHFGSGTVWVFRRGFVDSLTCTAAEWLQHADAICAAHPVTKVRLTTFPATDGDEDDIWFVGDPTPARFAHVDVLAEQTADERDSMAALCRLRWRRVKTFEFPDQSSLYRNLGTCTAPVWVTVNLPPEGTP